MFGKLSRIFETHGFADDDAALDDILEDFDPSLVYASESPRSSPLRNSTSQLGQSARSNPYSDRPSPYEVWHEKNKDKFIKKKPVSFDLYIKNNVSRELTHCISTLQVAKLNGQQWDNLVDKMHQSNRVKQRYAHEFVMISHEFTFLH